MKQILGMRCLDLFLFIFLQLFFLLEKSSTKVIFVVMSSEGLIGILFVAIYTTFYTLICSTLPTI